MKDEMKDEMKYETEDEMKHEMEDEMKGIMPSCTMHSHRSLWSNCSSACASCDVRNSPHG